MNYFLNTYIFPYKLPIIAVVLFALSLVGAFYYGKSIAREQADSEYLQEREQRFEHIAELEARARVHDENQAQLIAQNEILKKANEAAAETLKKSDAQLKGDAKKLDVLNTERVKKIEEINADNDFSSQVKGICEDYKTAGFQAPSFCAKFGDK